MTLEHLETALKKVGKLAVSTAWQVDFLLAQANLLENISDERRYGPSEQTRRDRRRVVEGLNLLCLTNLGYSFNSFCEEPVENSSSLLTTQPKQIERQATYYVFPTAEKISEQSLPVLDVFNIPEKYIYIGRLDSLSSDHFYRERDGHIAILFPESPGGFRAFLIDKYAITSKQMSLCLNELMQSGNAKIDRSGKFTKCVDKNGYPLIFDAVEYWPQHIVPQRPAKPWGLTYQQGNWQPLPGGELWPATLVTWWGARLYSQWAHSLPLEETGEQFTFLPSSVQWQRAALFDPLTKRQSLYPWGISWDRTLINYAGYWAGREMRSQVGLEHSKGVWSDPSHLPHPLPVADLSGGHSPIGCLQMLGNVWEWCLDLVPNTISQHFLRGGACNLPQEYCEPGYIIPWRTERASEYIGFRCAFSLA